MCDVCDVCKPVNSERSGACVCALAAVMMAGGVIALGFAPEFEGSLLILLCAVQPGINLPPVKCACV